MIQILYGQSRPDPTSTSKGDLAIDYFIDTDKTSLAVDMKVDNN